MSRGWMAVITADTHLATPLPVRGHEGQAEELVPCLRWSGTLSPQPQWDKGWEGPVAL